MFMNERMSGTEHVTAELAATTNCAQIGKGNYALTGGNQLAITITPANGEATIASGVLSWGGRLCGISNPETVRYQPPESETLYKKVVICAKYSKDTAGGIETIALVVLETDAVASESAAAALTLQTVADEITSATVTAFYPLWSFIATASSNTPPVQLFTLIPSMVELRDAIAGNAYSLQQEIAQRKSETEALFTSVAGIKKGLVVLATGLNGLQCENTQLKLSDFVAFIIRFTTGEVMTIPAVAGNYAKTFYGIEDAGSLTSATIVTEGKRFITIANFSHVKIMNGSVTNSDICGKLDAVYGIR